MPSVFKGSEHGTALSLWTLSTVLTHTKMSPYFLENFVRGNKSNKVMGRESSEIRRL